MMSQKRLCGLTVLSVVNETARSIDINEIIQTFASDNALKSRKYQMKEN